MVITHFQFSTFNFQFTKGATCPDLSSLPESLPEEVSSFIREWYNDKEYVTGHTSGSTGTPKTIPLLKKDMLASATLTNDFFGITSQSTLLLCLSPRYIAGKMMIVRALLAEANLLVLPPGGDPLATLDSVVDFAAMVPLQLEAILSHPGNARKLPMISQLIIGGAAVTPLLERQVSEQSTACYVTYGMTETVSHIALRPLNGKQAPYAALGEVHFETDERGCLVIYAPHLQQYRFVTNDIVHLIDTTHFEWLGRYDHVINSGGIKLSPETIEAKLTDLISQRFFITGEADNRLGEKAVLVIEDGPWRNERTAELLAQLKELLPPYEVPKAIRFLPALPMTASGKILRRG